MDLILKRKNKKGVAQQMLLLLIMAGVLIGIIGVFWIFSLVGPPLLSSTGTAKTIIQDSFQATNDQNLINASNNSIVPALETVNNLEWFSYGVIIMMFLAFIIMCFAVRVYPFLIFFWIVLVIIMVILSVYLTVAYQDFKTDSSLNAYYSSWENTDYILRYLPAIVTALGILGGIIMFILSSREQEAEAYSYAGGYPL